jgi:hypothetical protein
MKFMFLTAALAFSTAAIAQDQPPADPPVDAATTEATMPAPPAPAAGPVKVNPSPPVEQAFPPPPPKAEYPWCSRTVTDGCKQRNDPGNRR